MCLHHAGHRTFVGDGESAVTELGGAHDQLVRVRGATLKAVIAQRVELGIVRQRASEHIDAAQANTPCKNQMRRCASNTAVLSRSLKIHSSAPCSLR